jgi:peroxiredoxin
MGALGTTIAKVGVATVFSSPSHERARRRLNFVQLTAKATGMSIQTGERIPEVILKRIREGVETIDTIALFEGRKAVLFAVPGAFTPTCSEKHLPSYVEHFDEFRKRGIEVFCVSVNDPFVMQAWGKSQHIPDGLQMLADGNADLVRALGLEMDASSYGMGTRAKRFALYVEDGVVRNIFVEAPGEYKVSSAEHVLAAIG